MNRLVRWGGTLVAALAARNARLAAVCHITDDALFAYFKLMSARKHFLSTRAVCSHKRRVFVAGIIKKNANVIKTELLTYRFRNAW